MLFRKAYAPPKGAVMSSDVPNTRTRKKKLIPTSATLRMVEKKTCINFQKKIKNQEKKYTKEMQDLSCISKFLYLKVITTF